MKKSEACFWLHTLEKDVKDSLDYCVKQKESMENEANTNYIQAEIDKCEAEITAIGIAAAALTK